ncbi:MAG: cytochrome c3 family protein [Planctomycetota bacterium]
MEVTYTAALCCLLLPLTAVAETSGKLFGDVSDGSRAVPVHRLTLRDEQGGRILSDDEPALPFSAKETCGRCHSYGIINQGRHFNSVDANVAPGRVGQPWIYVDRTTATQIPISYRPWPGTYKPAQLGMTSWQFTLSFGRQSPGGGAGVLESEKPEEVMRQFVSGNLEINCLSCHSTHSAYNQAEYAGQIERENFRWAVTAACGFALVAGSARDMPDTYDPLMGDVPDDPKLIPPKVTYQKTAFDEKNKVHFEIVGKPAAERCYFCHSKVVLGNEEWEKWPTDEDVHLTAGMTCVDCHRNGLEHKIIRGYEGEALETQNPHAAGLSCKGCHLGEESSVVPLAGRMGAPVPKHSGIPLVHFDKLTCTACHSGPWPEQVTWSPSAYNLSGFCSRKRWQDCSECPPLAGLLGRYSRRKSLTTLARCSEVRNSRHYRRQVFTIRRLGGYRAGADSKSSWCDFLQKVGGRAAGLYLRRKALSA